MRELKLPGVEAVSQTESNEEDNEGTNDKVVADEMEEIEQNIENYKRENEIYDLDGNVSNVLYNLTDIESKFNNNNELIIYGVSLSLMSCVFTN